jgi:uncharacterized protein YllA (UPF0747 family)
MKSDELPGIPRNWIEFAAGINRRLSSMPASNQLQFLAENKDEVRRQACGRELLARLLSADYQSIPARTRQNMQRLQDTKSVVVAADLRASLFGGPMGQMLKCMTLIKICEDLLNSGVSAVPVCWISAGAQVHDSQWSVNVMDHDGGLHGMHLSAPDGTVLLPDNPLPQDSVSALISKIEKIGRGSFDNRVLKILRAAYNPKATLISASARFLTDLMGEWGLVVLHPQVESLVSISDEALKPFETGIARIQSRCGERESESAAEDRIVTSLKAAFPNRLLRSFMMPVIANIVDFNELDSFAEVLPVFDELGYVQPKLWPCVSATIVDARARRTLEKYNLNLDEFFSGKDEILKSITISHFVSEKLKDLELEVEKRMAEMNAHVPDPAEFLKMRDSSQERVIYQIRKLRNRFESADSRKKETMGRHVRHAGNLLAPNRQMQQNQLSMLGFLLHHTQAILGFLHEKLDIFNFNHQILFMD